MDQVTLFPIVLSSEHTFKWGSFAIIKLRYPSQSEHGFPVRKLPSHPPLKTVKILAYFTNFYIIYKGGKKQPHTLKK